MFRVCRIILTKNILKGLHGTLCQEQRKTKRVREGGVEQFAIGYKKFGPQLLLNSSIRSSDLSTLQLGLATYLNQHLHPAHSSQVRSYHIIDLWKPLKKSVKNSTVSY